MSATTSQVDHALVMIPFMQQLMLLLDALLNHVALVMRKFQVLKELLKRKYPIQLCSNANLKTFTRW